MNILHCPLCGKLGSSWLADVVFMMSCGRFCFLVPFLAALLVAEEKVDGPVIGDLRKAKVQQLQLGDYYGFLQMGVPESIGFNTETVYVYNVCYMDIM